MTTRVMHIIPKFHAACWGGAEAGIAALAVHLVGYGIETNVGTLKRANSHPVSATYLRVTDHLGFRGIRPSTSHHVKELMDRGAGAISPGIIWQALTDDIDLVHVHAHNRLSTSVVLSIVATRRLPIVYSIHSFFGEPDMCGAWRRWMLGFEKGLQRADRIVVVSEREWRALPQRWPELADRAVYIPNGVDTDFFSPGDEAQVEQSRRAMGISSDCIIVGVVGEIVPLKNQLEAVRILAHLRECGVESKLLLIGRLGSASYVRSVVEAARALGVDESMRFTGPLSPGGSQLVDAYRTLSALIIPSEHEAHPMVLNEALSTGTPVLIPSHAWANVSMLERGAVLPYSTPREAAELIVTVHNDPDVAARARAGALSHDWSSAARRYRDLYLGLVRRKGGVW